MSKHINIAATLKDGAMVLNVWKDNPGFSMSEMKLDDFTTFYSAVEVLSKECAQRQVELTGVQANLVDRLRQLSGLVTRFRAGMRSHFGPDSPQYEQAGGTRTSARKAPTRKSAADTPTVNAAAS